MSQFILLAALATKVASQLVIAMRLDVRFGSKADMCAAKGHVRFTPKSDRNSGHRRSHEGRAFLLCAVASDVNLLRYGEGIVHIDAEIPDSALYLGVTKQKLKRLRKIAGTAVDQRRFRSPK